VRRRLLAAGLSVEQGWAIRCGLDPFSEKFPVLTPDFVLKDTTVCVEVNPLDTRGRRVLQDGMRNALFTQVGWTVIRLRLGGQRPLGGYEVVTDGEPITEDVITTSLLAAVAAAVAGRPGTAHRGSSGPGLSLPWGGQCFFTGPQGEHVLVPWTFNPGGQEIIIDTAARSRPLDPYRGLRRRHPADRAAPRGRHTSDG
jgi:hypothetical protein